MPHTHNSFQTRCRTTGPTRSLTISDAGPQAQRSGFEGGWLISTLMFAFVSLLAWVPEAKANLMTGKPLSSTQPRSISTFQCHRRAAGASHAGWPTASGLVFAARSSPRSRCRRLLALALCAPSRATIADPARAHPAMLVSAVEIKDCFVRMAESCLLDSSSSTPGRASLAASTLSSLCAIAIRAI